MATIEDAFQSDHIVSDAVKNEMIRAIRFMFEERFETAQSWFCEELILDWLKAIDLIEETGSDGEGPYDFKKDCSGGMLVDPDLPLYVPDQVENVAVDERLRKFLQVKSHSFRLHHPWEYASDGWIRWRVLTDMVQRGEVMFKIRKKKLKLRLSQRYVAEIHTLAAL